MASILSHKRNEAWRFLGVTLRVSQYAILRFWWLAALDRERIPR